MRTGIGNKSELGHCVGPGKGEILDVREWDGWGANLRYGVWQVVGHSRHTVSKHRAQVSVAKQSFGAVYERKCRPTTAEY